MKTKWNHKKNLQLTKEKTEKEHTRNEELMEQIESKIVRFNLTVSIMTKCK